MGIQSTKYVTREWAVERLQTIQSLAFANDYVGMDDVTFEPGRSLENFVDTFMNDSDVSKWTDKMLENKLDEPFFRLSIFDNYIIGEEPDLVY